MKLAIACLAMTCAVTAFAHEDHAMPQMPKEFDTMKHLVGTWEGMNKMGDKEENVKVVYEPTSGGTAIAERMDPGTPHEMLTVYHKEGKSLGMTHYCAMGNQPHMHLKKSDSGSLVFEMTKPEGVSSMKEDHMHALTLTMVDADTLKQEWTNMKDGKKGETVTFTLKRK
jgi:hypothetical protein